MQHAVALGPGSFAKILTQLQEDLEKMGKARARKTSKHMLRQLENMDKKNTGMRSQDRMLRLTALLVAYEEGEVEDSDAALSGTGNLHGYGQEWSLSSRRALDREERRLTRMTKPRASS